jgi:DNA polymerase IV
VAQLIYTTACALHEAAGLPGGSRLRLVGVRASGLLPAATAQAQLAFGERPAAWREAEQAIDQIAGRFGADAVRPAALVRGRKPPR